MSSQPVPSVLAILLCDRIITEAGTNKKTLVGVFRTLRAAKIPISRQMGFYARLTDAEGKYKFRVEIVRLNDNQAIGRIETGELESTDRLAPVELAMNLPPVPFNQPGRYEFQLYGNEVYLGHISLDVTQRG